MFTTNVEARKEQGKGASRRLCVANRFPAIIYDGREAPLIVELDHDKATNMQVKAEFYSEALTIVIDDKEIKAKVQDAQRHPYKPGLSYIDFIRV